MLGALWGVVVAVALAIGAVLFWPIRLLMRKFRKPRPARAGRRPRQGVLSHRDPFLSVFDCSEASRPPVERLARRRALSAPSR